jgi:hypothetical protein
MENSGLHSSQVKISIFVNNHIFNVASCYRNECIVRNPIFIEPNSRGIFLMSIDGVEKKENILLPFGVSQEDTKVIFQVCEKEEQ